jgi:hypothetical protein
LFLTLSSVAFFVMNTSDSNRLANMAFLIPIQRPLFCFLQSLAEALCDIFGASVEQANGFSGDDIWEVAQSSYLVANRWARSIKQPDQAGLVAVIGRAHMNAVSWAAQYYGYVYENSGIVAKAFHLLAEGGQNPSQPNPKTTVTAVGFTTARDIFWDAVNNCLTPTSGFRAARLCTTQALNGAYAVQVGQAWDAVGVSASITVRSPITLTNGVTLSNQAIDRPYDSQLYLLPNIPAGVKVRCTSAGGKGDKGDAELYVRWNAEPIPFPVQEYVASANACSAVAYDTSNGSCTTSTGGNMASNTAYVVLFAKRVFDTVSLTCTTV